MLKIKTEIKKDNSIGIEIKGASSFGEVVIAIKALRDYILRNEQGAMTKEEINKTIIEVLESEEKK